jgi:hypothetical protein
MRRLLIVAVLLIPSATLTYGQDLGTPDTLRLETSGDWIIMTRADSMYSVGIWAWCDDYTIIGSSIPLRLTMSGPYYIPERFDPFIVIDTLIKDPSWNPQIYIFRRSVLKNDVGYPPGNTDTTLGFNGMLIGGVSFGSPPIFNIGFPTKIGDLILKIRRPYLLPTEFTIEIDSIFYPPAGVFKFSPLGGQGYAPYIEKVSIYVYSGWFSPPPCGDVDDNGLLDIEDIIALINHIFGGEPAPPPWLRGDIDCSGAIDIDDVVYLIYHLYGDGPDPCDPDGDYIPDCW